MGKLNKTEELKGMIEMRNEMGKIIENGFYASLISLHIADNILNKLNKEGWIREDKKWKQ